MWLDVTAAVPVADHDLDAGRVAGVDVGIIHPYAVACGEDALVVSGRALRAEERLHRVGAAHDREHRAAAESEERTPSTAEARGANPSRGATSPRRATFDAIAIALAGPLVEVAHRIPALFHHLLDEFVGLDDGVAGSIHKVSLHFAPGSLEPFLISRRQGTQRKRVRPLHSSFEGFLGFGSIAALPYDPIVFGAEADL